jgi:formylglycine-generating enzyme required for sulfatase activity
VHEVVIKDGFYLGRYEVTQAEWQKVTGNNPSFFKGERLPVDSVTWNETQAFIAKLNERGEGVTYRLPTEAEWEYACRAGTTGDYAGNISEMAWYSENAEKKTHSVGGKKPNAWGLADMQGNVWEWCQDWEHETYLGAPTDGSAWLSAGEQKHRVLRGGGWDGPATVLRSAHRGGGTPDTRWPDDGFRLVAVVRH